MEKNTVQNEEEARRGRARASTSTAQTTAEMRPKAIEFEDTPGTVARKDPVVLPSSIVEGMERLSIRGDDEESSVRFSPPGRNRYQNDPLESTVILPQEPTAVTMFGREEQSGSKEPTIDELRRALLDVGDVAASREGRTGCTRICYR